MRHGVYFGFDQGIRVTRRALSPVVDELHEGRSDKPAEPGAWKEEVRGGQHRHRGDDGQAEQHLGKAAAPPPDGETLVPDGRQQLLAVWVRYKL
jgi:hypothetical protein